MDEYTEIFIALGAATAANCGPCFDHYFSKAIRLGIEKEDVQKTVDIAVKVRGGSHMVMKGTIRKIMRSGSFQSESRCSSTSSCCD